jgi:hypothetical protein
MKTWAWFSVATGDLVHMQYPHGHRLATSGLILATPPMGSHSENGQSRTKLKKVRE